jgi:hypothetical protein
MLLWKRICLARLSTPDRASKQIRKILKIQFLFQRSRLSPTSLQSAKGKIDWATTVLPVCFNGAPNRPMWNQQAQNILVFRTIICQTHKPAALIIVCPALARTIHGQKCSKIFLNSSRQAYSASGKTPFDLVQFSLTEEKNTRDGFPNWSAKV